MRFFALNVFSSFLKLSLILSFERILQHNVLLVENI